MSKTCGGKSASKGKKKTKKSKKTADLFQLMRDLKPGEHFAEPPPEFAGDFRFSRLAACRSLRRYGVLREGTLYIYANQQHMEKNRLWRVVDLARTTISYRAKDRRILVELTERYQLKMSKTTFAQWIDNLRAHRLYALGKAAAAREPIQTPAVAVAVASGPAGSVTPAPIVAVVSVPCTPSRSTESEEQEQRPVVDVIQDGEKKARVQGPVAVVLPAPSSKEGAKKAVIQVSIVPKETSKLSESVSGGSKSAKPAKEPVAVAVEVFSKEPDATEGQASPVSVPVPVVVPPPSGNPSPPRAMLSAAQPLPIAPAAPSSGSTSTPPKKENKTPSKSPKEQNDDESADDESSANEVTPGKSEQQRSNSVRGFRTKLPAPMNPAPSLFRLIMSAIGRDVMRMALPASIMEPLSTLQVICEELENADLIERAMANAEPMWRMLYVAAFAMARYGSTAKRAGRMPFNPLLAETYEYVHPTAGWHFLAEQVSHHPPVTACYAEGNGWKYWQDCEVVASLSTSAVKATPAGLVYLYLERYRETYVWNKVTSQVTGILSGNYTIDHLGEMNVSCPQTKLKCTMNFKKMADGRRGDVDGRLTDENGKVLRNVYGSWTESFFAKKSNEANPTRLWRLADALPDAEKYYGLSRFAMGLNEMRPDIHGVLPLTDTRNRPDQRALEMGKVDEAEKLKRELEDKQRQRRKVSEAEKAPQKPLWFRATGNSDPAAGPRWKFNGKYWESKKEQFRDAEFVELW